MIGHTNRPDDPGSRGHRAVPSTLASATDRTGYGTPNGFKASAMQPRRADQGCSTVRQALSSARSFASTSSSQCSSTQSHITLSGWSNDLPMSVSA